MTLGLGFGLNLGLVMYSAGGGLDLGLRAGVATLALMVHCQSNITKEIRIT